MLWHLCIPVCRQCELQKKQKTWYLVLLRGYLPFICIRGKKQTIIYWFGNVKNQILFFFYLLLSCLISERRCKKMIANDKKKIRVNNGKEQKTLSQVGIKWKLHGIMTTMVLLQSGSWDSINGRASCSMCTFNLCLKQFYLSGSFLHFNSHLKCCTK